ncbi:MAG: polysaccharide deacetylase family protein [Pirellulales bacterium]
MGVLALGLFVATMLAGPASAEQGKIRLIVRADDMGSSHTANVACIQCCREGIVKSVEVMVPGPWYTEAVKMLKETPSIDVGVHLTLTSEWDSCKWGPITRAPSLADKHGHFFPMTSQRRDFPPNTGFLDAKPKLAEVEQELRAQIELAIADIPQVSHLSNHMGTATATPEMRALVERLSREYKLPLEAPAARNAGGLGAVPAGKEPAMVKVLERLTPGDWVLVEHPGQDTDEMRALGHVGYEGVAADRAGVTRAFTSAAGKAVIARRGIQLISYAEFQKR